MILTDENGKVINHNNIEHIEQGLAQKYITPNDKVLELGARYGSVSIITNKIVNDKSTHYVVEPDSSVWECLENNMKNNNCNFNIIKGVIGKTEGNNNKYKLEGDGYAKRSVVDNSYGKSQIETFDLPDIPFNVLIADCEGYLETFYDDNTKLFESLDKLILEFDEPKRCNYSRLKNELFNIGFVVKEEINHHGLYHYVFVKPKLNNNIVFCSLSDRPDFSKPMFDHLQQYCDIYDYKCVLENKVLDTTRAPSWSKIKLLQREMLNNPDIPYIVWVDDDIIITNKDIKFEELINSYQFKNILISKEVVPPFNCGILVCKNNTETYDYLQHIWELCEKYPSYKHKPNWEQEIFIKDYYMNQSHIFLIPYKIIQSFYRIQNRDWVKGHFSAHITGMSLDMRIQLRDEVLKIIT